MTQTPTCYIICIVVFLAVKWMILENISTGSSPGKDRVISPQNVNQHKGTDNYECPHTVRPFGFTLRKWWNGNIINKLSCLVFCLFPFHKSLKTELYFIITHSPLSFSSCTIPLFLFLCFTPFFSSYSSAPSLSSSSSDRKRANIHGTIITTLNTIIKGFFLLARDVASWHV